MVWNVDVVVGALKVPSGDTCLHLAVLQMDGFLEVLVDGHAVQLQISQRGSKTSTGRVNGKKAKAQGPNSSVTRCKKLLSMHQPRSYPAGHYLACIFTQEVATAYGMCWLLPHDLQASNLPVFV